MKIVDGTFEYTDERFPMGRDCACRLRVWEKDGRNIVLMTDLGDKAPGASVTNTVERIAAEACKEYDLDPAKTIFFEHYEHTETDRLETFDRVELKWSGVDGEVYKVASMPVWKPSTKKEFEVAIGEALL